MNRELIQGILSLYPHLNTELSDLNRKKNQVNVKKKDLQYLKSPSMFGIRNQNPVSKAEILTGLLGKESDIDERIQQVTGCMDSIEAFIDGLSEPGRSYLREYYIDGKSWNEISWTKYESSDSIRYNAKKTIDDWIKYGC